MSVIDLRKKRRERAQRDGAAAHAKGQAFAFEAVDFEDEDVGFIDHETHSLSILTCPEEGRGIALTKAGAEALIESLQGALASEYAPWNAKDLG